MVHKLTLRRLARRFDLRITPCGDLTIRRRRRGRGFTYEHADGTPVRDPAMLDRFRRLAVPPAYAKVRFAADPRAHLQALGEDAAGRVQYRYHPDWTLVRETLKADRLSAMAQSLPTILRKVRRALRTQTPDRTFALASVVHLVSLTAIRAGSDQYAQEHGTRGATTLLKSHLRGTGDALTLAFTGKGGKAIRKQVRDPDMARAAALLKTLPGPRLFKYRDAEGQVRAVRAGDVNAYLKDISGCAISLKDFRTLTASLGVLDQLGHLVPERSERGRRRQIREAIAPLADELANTLTVCRTSYVHDSVISAFETGKLKRATQASRSPTARMQVLSRLLRSKACRPARPTSGAALARALRRSAEQGAAEQGGTKS